MSHICEMFVRAGGASGHICRQPARKCAYHSDRGAVDGGSAGHFARSCPSCPRRNKVRTAPQYQCAQRPAQYLDNFDKVNHRVTHTLSLLSLDLLAIILSPLRLLSESLRTPLHRINVSFSTLSRVSTCHKNCWSQAQQDFCLHLACSSGA